MAKAYYPCAGCGEPLVILGRNRRDADRKAKWAEGEGFLCEKCEHEKRLKENKLAAEENRRAGLPLLQGSDAQVGWAETIRKNRLPRLSEEIESDAGFVPAGERSVFVKLLREESSAHWWIDNRFTPLESLYVLCRERIRFALNSLQAEDVPREVRDESVLRPEKPRTVQPVEIGVARSHVCVVYPKDTALIELLKRLRFGWVSGTWRMSIAGHTGTAEERAAQLISALLKAGFPVCCGDAGARRRALEGDYAPLHPRWLIAHGECIGVVWSEGDFFSETKAIPGARYTREHLPLKARYLVPATQFDRLRSFAELHDFRITADAERLLQRAQDRYEAALLVRDLPEPAVEKSVPAPESGVDGVAYELLDL